MASYQRNPMFGDGFNLDSIFGNSAGGTDVYSGSPVSPGVTTDPEGSGTSTDWTSVIAAGLGLGTSIVNAAAGHTTPAAVPAGVPARSVVPALGSGLAGSSSSLLLIGGLALAAILLLKK